MPDIHPWFKGVVLGGERHSVFHMPNTCCIYAWKQRSPHQPAGHIQPSTSYLDIWCGPTADTFGDFCFKAQHPNLETLIVRCTYTDICTRCTLYTDAYKTKCIWYKVWSCPNIVEMPPLADRGLLHSIRGLQEDMRLALYYWKHFPAATGVRNCLVTMEKAANLDGKQIQFLRLKFQPN